MFEFLPRNSVLWIQPAKEVCTEDRANVRVIPPIIPLIALACGIGVHMLTPVGIGPSWLVAPIGGVLAVVSLLVVTAAKQELKQANTTFDVRRTTTTLVSTSVFRFSRNPVCLSMMLLCTAIALLANSLPILLLSVPTGSALCHIAIRPEERYLEGKFGAQYLAYKAAVRRWI